jgi:hypothetical protein
MKPARVKNRLFGQVDMRRLPSIGSDHFPMFIKLVYSQCALEGLESTAEEESSGPMKRLSLSWPGT